MIKYNRSQAGQITITELIIVMAVIITIAVVTVGVINSSVRDIDDKYQTEVRQFFLQGE